MLQVLFCALALLLSAWPPAHAQLAIPALAQAAAPPKPPEPPVLSHAETRQMIELMNNPRRRAEFTATLETLAKAEAVVNLPKPAGPVPLAPNSVGAQVLTASGTWLALLSTQFVSFGHVLRNLPAVWAFVVSTLADHDQRARALDAAWHLTLVLAVAILAEWGTRRVLRRPIRAIALSAPDNTEQRSSAELAHASRVTARVQAALRAAEGEGAAPGLDESDAAIAADLAGAPLAGLPEAEREAVEVEHVLRRHRFTRVVRTLKRLPFVLLCFLLDLLPLGVFLGIGYVGTLFATDQLRDVLEAAVLAYSVCRIATAVTRVFFSPERPQLRLVHVSDQGAAYVLIWVRRVFVVGAFGYAASQIGLMLGLPGPANHAFLKTVFLVVHLFLIIMVLQSRASIADRIRSHSLNPGVGARMRNRLASVWHLIAIFYIAGLWVVWAAEVRHGYVRIWHIFLATALVLTVARMISIVVLGALDRSLRISADTRSRYPGLEQRANRYTPLLRSAVSAGLVATTGLALLQVWGIDTLAWFHTNALGSQLVSAIVTILIAAAIAVAVWEGVNASMDRHLAHLTRHAHMMRAARLRTLLPILRTMLLITLLAVFGLTALSEIGVNIAPLLAGAGILGVAIGFGSQKLVQDFITGIFLLVENAMQVGDWVTVAGLSGSVENLSIRTMRLRAGDGSVHIIPFSSVSTVTNVNRGIGNAAVTVNVPIEEDSDHVSEILSEIARGMRRERLYAEMMRSDFQLWGVDKVDAGVVTIVGQIVCTDTGRWGVQREFNRRMNVRFKELGIRIATPVQTVYNHIASEPPKIVSPPRADAAPPVNQVSESPPPSALGNTS